MLGACTQLHTALQITTKKTFDLTARQWSTVIGAIHINTYINDVFSCHSVSLMLLPIVSVFSPTVRTQTHAHAYTHIYNSAVKCAHSMRHCLARQCCNRWIYCLVIDCLVCFCYCCCNIVNRWRPFGVVWFDDFSFAQPQRQELIDHMWNN